ncbi:MAG: alanine:cation symporter family protein [Polyangiales bacterium]
MRPPPPADPFARARRFSEPFIDTVVICTMTALVVVITGAYESGDDKGVVMTSSAFATVLPWFPNVLTVAVFLFAYSTMISWSYYGERSWAFLFGANPRVSLIYKLLFLCFTVLGSVLTLGSVMGFSDLMILGMAFPNILELTLLSGKVRARLNDYWGRFTSGQMRRPSRGRLRAFAQRTHHGHGRAYTGKVRPEGRGTERLPLHT